MGVNVNAVAPGFLDTGMTRDLSDEQRAKVARRSALKRLVSVEDVANAVEFLLGDKAANITGTVLTVDGGSTAEPGNLTLNRRIGAPNQRKLLCENDF